MIIEIEAVKYRFLIDAGVAASYASSALINHINKKPIQSETKKIKTLLTLLALCKKSGHQL